MASQQCELKIRIHIARRGFKDVIIECNMSGRYKEDSGRPGPSKARTCFSDIPEYYISFAHWNPNFTNLGLKHQGRSHPTSWQESCLTLTVFMKEAEADMPPTAAPQHRWPPKAHHEGQAASTITTTVTIIQ